MTSEGAPATRIEAPARSAPPGSRPAAPPRAAIANRRRQRRANGPPPSRAGGSWGRRQPDDGRSCGGFHPLQLVHRHVQGRLLVQPAEQRLRRGEGAVLEILVARRAAAAEAEVAALLPAH